MLAIALRHAPRAACIVPEKREERRRPKPRPERRVKARNHLAPFVRALQDAGIRVSLFIEPERDALDAAVALGAPVVELHTGSFCEADIDGDTTNRARELRRLEDAAAYAERLGLECHAGHGLTFDTVGDVVPPFRRWSNSISAISWSVKRFSAGSRARSNGCAALWTTPAPKPPARAAPKPASL